MILVPGVEVAGKELPLQCAFVTDFHAFYSLKNGEAPRSRALQPGAYCFMELITWLKETPNWAPPASTLHERGLIQGFEVVKSYVVLSGGLPLGKGASDADVR